MKKPSRSRRGLPGRRPRPVVLGLERMEARQLLATIVVTSTGDAIAVDGFVTLREAITAANGNADVSDVVAVGAYGADIIEFDIVGPGVQTIAPATALPTITDPLTIDGYTQGAAAPNTLAVGNDAVILVELSGVAAGVAVDGLAIAAAGSTVRGLAINRFQGFGIVVTADAATIAGSFIGTDPTGTMALGNTLGGVALRSTNATIGGATPADRDLIAGNGVAGVLITGVGATGNRVAGSYLGTNAAGTTALGATSVGVQIDLDASANTVGGLAASGAGNLISGNLTAGVRIDDATTNLVLGNFIGTDRTGTAAIGGAPGGTLGGVVVSGRATDNTVGGGAIGAGNLIAANAGSGVALVEAIRTTVVGNTIGLDVSGTIDLGNVLDGVLVDDGSTGSNGNTIGGLAVGLRNLIAGNEGVGVRISGIDATANVVVGNLIGTDAAGTLDLGNAGPGVSLLDSTSANTVAGNTIAGNSGAGLFLDAAADNSVAGNLIGLGSTGTALPNAAGIVVQNTSSGNTIGGSAPNVVSGNAGAGISIASDDNLVAGNLVGINAAGTAAVGNQGDGINVGSGTGNTVGGNTVGGNAGAGLSVGGTGNLVVGNLVGTDGAGTAALANSVGAAIAGAGNTIGGTAPGDGNLFSGNAGAGIAIDGDNNLVLGNRVGTDLAGTLALGNAVGLSIAGMGNTIGGTAAGSANLVGGNSGVGLAIGGMGNLVVGNLVGTDGGFALDLGNGAAGVSIGGVDNTIGGATAAFGNTIGFNAGAGVLVATGSGNRILTNAIDLNDGLGIDLQAGANNDQPAPSLLGAIVVAPGQVQIAGSLTAAANTAYTIQFFASPAGDPSGFGEGRTFLGEQAVTTDGTGTIVFTTATLTGSFARSAVFTATATAVVAGDTSEFSNFVGQLLVTNVNPAGAGSLARAILNANLLPGLDTIAFAIPGTGVQTIQPTTGMLLPAVMDAALIDGTTQPGFAGTPLIQIDGTNAGAAADGLVIMTNGATVRGLTINRFTRDGLRIIGANNRVVGTVIGLDPAGATDLGNGDDGIEIVTGSGNTIGGALAADRNLIGGNGDDGIAIAAAGNFVVGNYIGTDRAGTVALGNDGDGVFVANVGGNRIGPGNVVSGNAGFGVHLAGAAATGNRVVGNFVGLDAAGTAALGNLLSGVGLDTGATANTIGGAVAADRNVIGGNVEDGVTLDAAPGNFVIGNYIGTNADGSAAVRNLDDGIVLATGATGTTIRGNVVSGNGEGTVVIYHGILIATANNLVVGNFVGLDATGTMAVGNQDDGIRIEGLAATGNTIGGTTPADRNVVSGNGRVGIVVTGDADSNRILGNYVGTNAAGDAAVANTLSGVVIELDSSGNTISGNLLSGNAARGLELNAPGNRATGNTIGANAAGTAAVGNSLGGVLVTANANTIGGAAAGLGNTISGNTGPGVQITGVADNLTTPTLRVIGNTIGLAVFGNTGDGILVDGGSTGLTVGPANLIGGNTQSGVHFAGTGTTGHRVIGNTIGLDAAGTVAVANGLDGVRVDGGAGAVTVGGLVAAQGNTIGGNAFDGIHIEGDANLIVGNRIAGNLDDGIDIATGTANTVGGTVAGAANLIVGNDDAGVEIGGSDNQVVGNTIGALGLGNGTGVSVVATGTGNTVGGTAAGLANFIRLNTGDGVAIAGSGNLVAGNLITGNGDDGVDVSGVGNAVVGNFVGTDSSSTSGLGNTDDGIAVSGADNTIGGASPNVTSGNLGNGIRLTGALATGNQVVGNFVGTDLTGTLDLGNSASGVAIDAGASMNTVGGDGADAAQRNTIRFNAIAGVQLSGSGTTANLVAGNLIDQNDADGVRIDTSATANTIGGGNTITASGANGLFITSAASLNLATLNTITGSAGAGVLIDGASGNTVSASAITANAIDGARLQTTNPGNSTTGNVLDGNTITGNTGDGVRITDAGTRLNTASGNVISTNTDDGVQIDGGASGNAVDGNTIADNAFAGLRITGLGTNQNTAAANTITGHTQSGAIVEDRASANTIGAGNLIVDNDDAGVLIDGASLNVVAANTIGLDLAGTVAIPNATDGVRIQDSLANPIGGGAIGNTIDANTIGGNSRHGLFLFGNTVSGTVSGNVATANLISPITPSVPTNLPNAVDAVRIEDARNNTIGAGNTIAGSLTVGVRITGAGATGNRVQGTTIIRSAGAGVSVENSASGNVIGAGNTIGGAIAIDRNSGPGVLLTGIASDRNTVTGSLIVGNVGDGVRVEMGSSENVIGPGNTINDNLGFGVLLTGVDSDFNTVTGNAIANNLFGGIAIRDGSSGNVIGDNTLGGGGPGLSPGYGLLLTDATFGQLVANNTITRFALGGVRVEDDSSNNTLTGNTISLNALDGVPSDDGDGVILTGALTDSNVLTANTIGGNARDGVRVEMGSSDNSIGAGNSIGGNSGFGIRLTGLDSDRNTVSGGTFTGNSLGGAVAEIGSSANLFRGNTFLGIAANTPSPGYGVLLTGLDSDLNTLTGNTITNYALGGVRVEDGSSSNTLAGNTNSLNALDGIPSDDGDGVILTGALTDFNVLTNNTITGNARDGVRVEMGSSDNTIGAGNVVSANLGNGILLDASPNNRIFDNRIGTTANGLTGDGNTGNGLVAQNGSTGATITGNVVSANSLNGVVLDGLIVAEFTGNQIGTDATGTVDLGNALRGLVLQGPGANNNLIGPNLISGNDAGGVLIDVGPVVTTTGVTITGATIGLNLAGTGRLGNVGSGVEVRNGSNNTEILGNLISANTSHGVLANSVTGLVVANNGIGLDATGTVGLGNGGDGVRLESAAVGTITANTISNNDGNGISLVSVGGTTTTGSVVTGNLIGTNSLGTAALGNRGAGVSITGGGDHTIGGATTILGNLISANTLGGVVLSDAAARVLIAGNTIGLDVGGSVALGNTVGGVALTTGSTLNTIGGAAAGFRNVISGNVAPGVLIDGSPANLVQGNYVGTDAGGTIDLGNTGDGITLRSSSDATVTGNVASGNGGNGVLVDASPDASIDGNVIGLAFDGAATLGGVATPGGNDLDGVAVIGAGSTGVTITGNTIGDNRQSGVHVTGPAGGVSITANRIGTDVGGTLRRGNALHGVFLDGSTANTVNAANIIAANLGHGVLIQSTATASAADNLVANNLIGLALGGTIALGNGLSGVAIDGSVGSSIHGALSNDVLGNTISGNARYGVVLSGPAENTITGLGAVGNIVAGNLIGTDATGTLARGNLLGGVAIFSRATANTIGGATTADRNLISGNGGHGLAIAGTGANDNRVAGNFIGTDLSGTLPLGNALSGVYVGDGSAFSPTVSGSAQANTIGGATAAFRNVISANAQDGVRINGAGASLNLVAGNFIGTDMTGTLALGNSLSGVAILGGASANVVGVGNDGNTIGGAANVISGNLGDGVRLADANTSANLVAGNLIGLAVGGNAPLANLGDGVDSGSGATGNTIGGLTAALRNTISANSLAGVALTGINELVVGNFIGTDATGTLARGNAGPGVRIDGGAGRNSIGGAAAAAGNVISANLQGGVSIAGAATTNLVAGNFIGTDATGTLALGNTLSGVEITGGATRNVIGVGDNGNTIGGAANVIADNRGAGVEITGAGTTMNLVAGNFIGTDLGRTLRLGNANGGVRIAGMATSNTIGGVAGNTIAANSVGGVIVADGGTSMNVVAGNTIGGAVGTTIGGNVGPGVAIRLGATNNTIGAGNLIATNMGDGVAIADVDTTTNFVVDNTIADNRGDGVEITGPAGGNTVDINRIDDNDADGVFLDDSGANTVTGNAVTANGANGIHLIAAGATTNRVAGNNVAGNARDGIRLEGGANANTIGGLAAGDVNVVTANLRHGVVIDGSTANVLVGFRVGIGLGGAGGAGPVGNTGDGIRLVNAPGNIVGVAPGAIVPQGGSVVSANGGAGIRIVGPGGANVVAAVRVGTDAAGTIALGNRGDGVRVEDSPNNLIGGIGNLVSGNLGDGIVITGAGATGNRIQANRVGTDLNGTAALGNQRAGIRILSAAGNLVGVGSANVISGNAGTGLVIQGPGSTSNTVAGNFLGTNLAGNAAIANGDGGVLVLDAGANVIGGTGPADGNYISGNAGAGVAVRGGTGQSAIVANFIGTALGGGSALPNTGDGVRIENSPGNLVGGVRNFIAGNLGHGVAIVGSLAAGNSVQDNRIGLVDVTGQPVRLGNGGIGVLIDSAPNNSIGGESSNVIAGNSTGLAITGPGASGNVVQINFIGTAFGGQVAVGNTFDGIFLNGAPGTTIGGPGAGNVISGNGGFGIETFGTPRVSVVDNFVGTNSGGTSALANAIDGVLLVDSPDARIAFNIVSGNRGTGLTLRGAGTARASVDNNVVGLDRTGTVALGNAASGILIDGAINNSVSGNLLSANAVGLAISGPGAVGNRATDNRIGTNAAGSAPLGNALFGVLFDNGASANTVGTGNLIGGNVVAQVLIQNGAQSNAIRGNIVGLDATGTRTLDNRVAFNAVTGATTDARADGIVIAGAGTSANVVGGPDAAGLNVIAGHRHGVRVASAASGNLLMINFIGLDVTGQSVPLVAALPGTSVAFGYGVATIAGRPVIVPLANSYGVAILAASNNTVGAGNLISGNAEAGVVIAGATDAVAPFSLLAGVAGLIGPADFNVVTTSVIGLDRFGITANAPGSTLPLGNGTGILIYGGSNNTVGAGNFISGNREIGVEILNGATVQQPNVSVSGATTTRNLVTSNTIGLDFLRTSAFDVRGIRLGNSQGVLINDAPNNSVTNNLISGNRVAGVQLFEAFASGNTIGGSAALGNTIGGSAALGNTIGGNAAGQTRDARGQQTGNGFDLGPPIRGLPQEGFGVFSGLTGSDQIVGNNLAGNREAIGNRFARDGFTFQDLFGYNAGANGVLVLRFNAYLNRASATDPARYRIARQAGGGVIPVVGVSYNELDRAVTLVLGAPLDRGQRYQVTVRGSLWGRDNILLDGTFQSRPGQDFVGIVQDGALISVPSGPANSNTNRRGAAGAAAIRATAAAPRRTLIRVEAAATAPVDPSALDRLAAAGDLPRARRRG